MTSTRDTASAGSARAEAKSGTRADAKSAGSTERAFGILPPLEPLTPAQFAKRYRVQWLPIIVTKQAIETVKLARALETASNNDPRAFGQACNPLLYFASWWLMRDALLFGSGNTFNIS
jgi:hypothetical protein